MDFLTISLIFLTLLLAVFLTVTGMQVFFILRDLKKALDRLNKVLDAGENIIEDVEKPVKVASNLVKALTDKTKDLVRKDSKSKAKRFYKKVL